ncbi:UbiA prenyltransferase family-domain-containing protein [Penicillium daleae]|uniref:UbiA prenyltransferase family-domain-containing protein n=1 Tax=Penicillium daleae TaxID=63821 RepID=A0AAD6G4L2_9EURO|nr:UbiA prenyltransferase family-domain-containing protein [Penicillium daleae]KAJ5459519.1 UbiA prenyltransferase family-domain-containing protein [Penicillium daleae]
MLILQSILTTKLPESRFKYFPHLPPYTDPTTGILSMLPSSWVHYAQLMRLELPGGFYAFYFLYIIGILYAACIAPQTPSPTKLLSLAAIMMPFNILLRGVACSWNDNVDQEFDRQVVRCRHRPVARGAVTTIQAHASYSSPNTQYSATFQRPAHRMCSSPSCFYSSMLS